MLTRYPNATRQSISSFVNDERPGLIMADTFHTGPESRSLTITKQQLYAVAILNAHCQGCNDGCDCQARRAEFRILETAIFTFVSHCAFIILTYAFVYQYVCVCDVLSVRQRAPTDPTGPSWSPPYSDSHFAHPTSHHRDQAAQRGQTGIRDWSTQNEAAGMAGVYVEGLVRTQVQVRERAVFCSPSLSLSLRDMR